MRGAKPRRKEERENESRGVKLGICHPYLKKI